MVPTVPFTPLPAPVSQIAAPPVSISAAHVNPAFLPAAAKVRAIPTIGIHFEFSLKERKMRLDFQRLINF